MMQRLILLLSLFIVSNSLSAAMLLSGKVVNPQDSFVKIILLPTTLGEDKMELTLPLSKGNTFQLNLPLNKPTFADLYHSKIAFPIFLDPAHQVKVLLRAVNHKQGKLTFQGDGGPDNTFHLEYIKHINNELENRTLADIKNSKSKDFKEFVNQLKSGKLKFIRDYINKKSFTPNRNLLIWLKNDIEYESADLLLRYPYLYHIANDKMKTKDLPKKYYKFLEEVRLNNERAILQPSYQNFLHSYFFQYRIAKAKDWLALQAFDRQYSFAEKFFIDGPLYYVQSTILTDALNDNPSNIEDEYRMFITGKAPKALKDQVKSIYYLTTSPIKGKELPPLVFRDLNGNEISGNLFKNKVSYIYFWSHYNERCRFEMKYARTLVKKFEEEDKVNILFVSTDPDISNLKSFINNKTNELNDPNLTHLVLDQNQSEEFKASYRIKNVPHFFLIDPSGRIVSEQTWPPSSGGAARVIKRLLSEVF